jgi:hypothetical protein
MAIDKKAARLAAFIVIGRKLAKQLNDEIDALELALNEEPTPGQLAKQVLDFFVTRWETLYRGDKYVVSGKKDMASLIRVVKQLGAREVAVRMKAYLASTDKFYQDTKHGLPAFIGSINKFSTSNPATYVVGCTHTPRCGDDAQHTRRSLDEAKRRS